MVKVWLKVSLGPWSAWEGLVLLGYKGVANWEFYPGKVPTNWGLFPFSQKPIWVLRNSRFGLLQQKTLISNRKRPLVFLAQISGKEPSEPGGNQGLKNGEGLTWKAEGKTSNWVKVGKEEVTKRA